MIGGIVHQSGLFAHGGNLEGIPNPGQGIARSRGSA
jgi:hypothetical protein